MKGNSSISIRLVGKSFLLLIAYGCWWIYVFYFLYWKEYDNNYAGATASIGIGILTVLISVIYVVGFTLAAVKEKRYKQLFLLIIPILLIPFIGIFLYESMR